MTAVSVSIDGTAETHDHLRGMKGSHAAALNTLRHLKNAGLRAGCNTQLNRRNFRELRQIADLIVPFAPYGWQVQLMVPMGRAADAEDLWLQPYDILELIPLLAEVREYCDSRNLKLWPGDNVGYFGPYEHTLRRDRTRCGHSGGCGGGVLTMGIEAHGDIKGCSAMSSDGFVGGNVRTHRLQDVWDNAKELRFSRDFKVEDLWGYCRSCYYADICKGGCIWTASTIMGRRGNNPYCHHRALEMLASGKREKLVRLQMASGAIRDRARFEIIEEEAPSDWMENIAHSSRRPEITTTPP
jgi:radical SAM protein with 4Fe4S-binding SPASM domain